MNMFSGGRGKKAPYETLVIRVPLPLAPSVEKQIESYREFIVSGTQPSEDRVVSREEAVAHAKEILKQKKSAKQSLEKLLQVLYGGEISLKD